jgi:hypothetical protein
LLQRVRCLDRHTSTTNAMSSICCCCACVVI